jgi:hypothetical protein
MAESPFIVLLLSIIVFLVFFAMYCYFMYWLLNMAKKSPIFKNK